MYELTLRISNDDSLLKLVTAMDKISGQVIDIEGYNPDSIGINESTYKYNTPPNRNISNVFLTPALSPSLFVGLVKLLHAPWGVALLRHLDFSLVAAIAIGEAYWFTTFDRKTITWSGFESVDEKERYCHSAGILAIDHQNFLEINADERYLALNYYNEIAKENLVAVFKYKC